MQFHWCNKPSRYVLCIPLCPAIHSSGKKNETSNYGSLSYSSAVANSYSGSGSIGTVSYPVDQR
jgi:hypothetical protein